MVNNKNDSHFLPGPNEEGDRRASAKIRKEMQNRFKDMFFFFRKRMLLRHIIITDQRWQKAIPDPLMFMANTNHSKKNSSATEIIEHLDVEKSAE